MGRKLNGLSRRYQAALGRHLKQGRNGGLESARGLGSLALAAGIQTLDLAKLHEETLVTELLPACPPGKHSALIKQAGTFFASAVTPIEKTHRSAKDAALRLKQFI